jgi:hypothetical protein
MGKRRSDSDIEDLVENWIGISKDQDPIAWQAWTAWRRDQLRVASMPDNLTVPSPFPPATIAAAKEYVAIVQQIRAAIGWKDSRSRLPTNISAWMGA